MKCRNPQHPSSLNREMLFLESKDGVYVFACKACKEVNRKLSVQVVTGAALKRMVRNNLWAEGKLMTSAPPVRQPHMIGGRKRIEWEGRKSKDGCYELVLYRDLGQGELQVQMAIDGRLCPMMDDHIASREQYPDDESYFSRVAESSELMLHLYGDARTPLPEEVVQQRQQTSF